MSVPREVDPQIAEAYVHQRLYDEYAPLERICGRCVYRFVRLVLNLYHDYLLEIGVAENVGTEQDRPSDYDRQYLTERLGRARFPQHSAECIFTEEPPGNGDKA